jgi:hypothetical protein
MLKGKGDNSMDEKRQTGENAVAKVGAARPARHGKSLIV